jgi:5-methylcytosine-specific restriction protein A
VAGAKWHRDEFILVLDLYLRHDFNKLSPASPVVVEASQLLNAMPFNRDKRDAKYRSPSSVLLRMSNFVHHDSRYPGEGMAAGGEDCRRVWEELGSKPALVTQLAQEIRVALASKGTEEPLTLEEETAEEGQLLARLHMNRERNPALVSKKKQAVLKQHGRLACEVCGFDFSAAYGERGEGFIECHHRIPLSQLATVTRTRLADLAVLCANCHRMIHRKPWLSVEALAGALPNPR